MVSSEELKPDRSKPGRDDKVNWKNRILFALIFGGLSALIVGGFWLIRDVTPTPQQEPLPAPLSSASREHAVVIRGELSRRYQEDIRLLKTARVRYVTDGTGLAGRAFKREDKAGNDQSLYFVRFELLGDERRKIEAVVALDQGVVDQVLPVTFLDYGRLRRGYKVQPTPALKKPAKTAFGQR